ncbi:MAG: site-specific DNA-methyltransferase, partial [bacterium]|nr:site-specific DNA-methyltransferase [bacterium]
MSARKEKLKLLSEIELTGGTLVKSENLDFLKSFHQELKEKIELIYIDPPFFTQKDFYTSDKYKYQKQPKVKEIAYQDKWGGSIENYLVFMRERLFLMRELLSESGSLYLHCDYRTSAHLRILLEEVFGEKNYINEIIWFYKTGGMPKGLGFAKKHDTIHFVTKNHKKATWNPQREKSYLSHKYGFKNIDLKEDEAGIYNLVGMRDVWEIPALRGNQPERLNYPTQKPEVLLERIILASTKKDDVVADFFAGSGTTGAVAKRLGRKWLLVDQGDVSNSI